MADVGQQPVANLSASLLAALHAFTGNDAKNCRDGPGPAAGTTAQRRLSA